MLYFLVLLSAINAVTMTVDKNPCTTITEQHKEGSNYDCILANNTRTLSCWGNNRNDNNYANELGIK